MSDVAVTISPTTVVVEDSGVSIQIAGGISYNGATAAIAAEVARAIAAENSLAGTIATVDANLTQEVTDRESADAAIIASLSVYATTSALTSAINTEIAARNTAIGVETSRATAAEGTLQSAITAQANVLSWLHMIGDLHFSPAPGSTYFFDNAIVRAYQFNINNRTLLSGDANDQIAINGISGGNHYANIDVSAPLAMTIRDINGSPIVTTLGTITTPSVVFPTANGAHIEGYDWSANPAVYQGVRIDGAASGLSVALFAVANGILYAWDPIGGTGGGFRSDNFSNGTGTFSVDVSGNGKLSTLKFGGSAAIAISESPANVMQATLADLSTLIPVRMRGAALQGAAPAHGDPGVEGEIRFDSTHVYRYTSSAWYSAPLIFTAV
jgi:hypothetical protein